MATRRENLTVELEPDLREAVTRWAVGGPPRRQLPAPHRTDQARVAALSVASAITPRSSMPIAGRTRPCCSTSTGGLSAPGAGWSAPMCGRIGASDRPGEPDQLALAAAMKKILPERAPHPAPCPARGPDGLYGGWMGGWVPCNAVRSTNALLFATFRMLSPAAVRSAGRADLPGS
jgi:hypothetical protein